MADPNLSVESMTRGSLAARIGTTATRHLLPSENNSTRNRLLPAVNTKLYTCWHDFETYVGGGCAETGQHDYFILTRFKNERDCSVSSAGARAEVLTACKSLLTLVQAQS